MQLAGPHMAELYGGVRSPTCRGVGNTNSGDDHTSTGGGSKANFGHDGSGDRDLVAKFFSKDHTFYIELDLISSISKPKGGNRTLRIEIRDRYCFQIFLQKIEDLQIINQTFKISNKSSQNPGFPKHPIKIGDFQKIQ